ncbi:phosphoribosylanthranilate isomerase [Peribacillus deserti]|uniref:N-(5'-phosphoribosyl)anthranilate isomerase n=1 Tax=Peribacillus deserti TaxID=673318 RepID=A0A2N5M6L3_9BACI|nr:phosphoribosylanthranilate isomerase [Peribacillus deserti]PLT29933.1 N-(5'-phosphoribosyl)anthranilate isomerase [Peribacillus deserti]
MKVKICGIMDKETAHAAVNFGADALGFVFAESKRKIDKESAKQIIDSLPEEVQKVGVFVNESKEHIEQIADYTGLTMIQLHGEEEEHFIQALSLPVIKGIPFQNGISTILQKSKADSVLLDAPKGKYRGGNGQRFEWQEARDLGLEVKNLILAGGLTPENVEEAIGVIRPSMVDVSSGVETEGKKDHQKIKKFIENAKTGVVSE